MGDFITQKVRNKCKSPADLREFTAWQAPVHGRVPVRVSQKDDSGTQDSIKSRTSRELTLNLGVPSSLGLQYRVHSRSLCQPLHMVGPEDDTVHQCLPLEVDCLGNTC